MWWPFGSHHQEQSEDFSQNVESSSGSSEESSEDYSPTKNAGKPRMDPDIFDSNILEQAVAVAKELEKIAHERKTLKQAEKSIKLAESLIRAKKQELVIGKLQLEQKQIANEIRIKSVAEEIKQHRIRMQIEAQYSRFASERER